MKNEEDTGDTADQCWRSLWERLAIDLFLSAALNRRSSIFWAIFQKVAISIRSRFRSQFSKKRTSFDVSRAESRVRTAVAFRTAPTFLPGTIYFYFFWDFSLRSKRVKPDVNPERLQIVEWSNPMACLCSVCTVFPRVWVSILHETEVIWLPTDATTVWFVALCLLYSRLP